MCIIYPDGRKYIHFDMVQTLANMKSLHMTKRMICNMMYVKDTTQYLPADWKNLVIEDCCNHPHYDPDPQLRALNRANNFFMTMKCLEIFKITLYITTLYKYVSILIRSHYTIQNARQSRIIRCDFHTSGIENVS